MDCWCPEQTNEYCYKCNPERVAIKHEEISTIYNTFRDIYLEHEQKVIELACQIFDDITIKHRRKNRIVCAFTCLFLAKYIIYKGIGSIQYIDILRSKNVDKEYILDRKKLHFKIYNIRLNIESISKHILLNTFDYIHINDVILNTMYLIKYDSFNIDDIDIYDIITNNYENIHIDIGVAICILYLIEKDQKEYIKDIYTLNNKNRYKITIDCNFMSVYALVNSTLNRTINYTRIDQKCIKCKSRIVFKDTILCLKHSIYNL